MRSPRKLAAGLAAGLAALLATVLPLPAHADPAADMTLLFSSLCVESRLSISELVTTWTQVTPGEPPLEGPVTDREQIYIREIKLGDTDVTLQAVAPADSARFRNCRLSAQFPTAAAVEIHLDRMFPEARRTEPVVQRMPIGDAQFFSITVQWIAPRPGIAAIDATVEVLGKRRKAILTAVPTP